MSQTRKFILPSNNSKFVRLFYCNCGTVDKKKIEQNNKCSLKRLRTFIRKYMIIVFGRYFSVRSREKK